ncbi:MAG TPA: acetylornithine deacetylase [Methyloceanibacter sp.]|jgi:acetylornithine deacetylase
MATTATPQELLAKLVAFDTTSAKSNLKLINFVQSYLKDHAISSIAIPSPDGSKAALFATVGPEGKNGIGLSGHSDCVPVEGQNWRSDPFTLTPRDGKLYGRGSCDMKGFLACVLASVPLFKSRKLKDPIHIIVSYDEEVGCTGVRPLIELLGKELPKPKAIIVGEATDMTTIDAHKRIDSYLTVVTGREAHSSLPQLGINAIAVAAKLVLELERLGAELARVKDDRFDPPFGTMQVGTIKGGTAGNIVPKDCEFHWQIRSLPGTGPSKIEQAFARSTEELLTDMRQVAPDAGIVTKLLNSVPSFQAQGNSEAVALALSLSGANSTHAVSYGTEAGLFEEAGCPTVICGPGSIAQAHAADEFVTVAQLDLCMAFLARFADRLS